MGMLETMIIQCAEDCGNSPKKLLLKDFTIAMAKNELDFCIDHLREDITWEIVGHEKIQGITDVEQALHKNKYQSVQKLHIQNIITHGNTASVNGTITENNDETIAFCHVYNFGGFGKKAKIKAVTSYIIQLNASA